MKTINHKFIDELNQLEENRIFANRKITGKNKLLIIGTFNPYDEMVEKTIDAVQRNFDIDCCHRKIIVILGI